MSALFSKSASAKPQHSFPFHSYAPNVKTNQLVPGIDNIRFDVCLSPRFLEFCRPLLLQLVLKHSGAAELMHKPPGQPKPSDKKEVKQSLQDLLVTVLKRANVEKNPQLEVLVQTAVFKYMVGELQAQHAAITVQAREKLKLFEGPGQEHRPRGYQLQEQFGNFQKNRKIILRRAGQELLGMVSEARGGVVRKTRESFFGSEASEPHAVFSNPLIFTEDGKDDYLNLEHYILLGNFQRDPDRLELVDEQVRSLLEWADSHSEESRNYYSRRESCAELSMRLETLRKQVEEQGTKRGFFSLSGRTVTQVPAKLKSEIASLESRLNEQLEAFHLVSDSYAARLDAIAAAPANAALLVDTFQTEQQIAEARKEKAGAEKIASLKQKAGQQKEALDKLYDQFQRAGLIPYILAAYETAGIYQDFCPPIHPQQLKEALVEEGERKKVAHLIREYRLPTASTATLEEAARRVRDAGSKEIRAVLVRFLSDYMRYQHDLRDFHLVQRLMEHVHLPVDQKQLELSEINRTLYRFLLAEEHGPSEDKVSSHAILKADIRDSTSITAQLYSRGLNPASYFSLNFFQPITKLLPRYGAFKVFLEGDAVILAILERENDTLGTNSVARISCLARDMIEGVRAVNDQAARKNLPLLELGIGISFQPAAPMYLMDGETPIMISKALNESDRLSSCGKLAKRVVGQKSRFFRVFVMQLLPDAESGGASEEFLLHYNVEGVEINEAAFNKLSQELSLSRVELKMPLLGDPETVELYCGSLPIGRESFQRVVVRRGRVPQLHPKDFRIVEYTDRYYYEVCCGKPIYDYVGKQLGWSTHLPDNLAS
ncbi:MAG: hypothetical protein O7E51_03890 [Acidobacteria bacterium]|nr:hypothetical protein [Acidobacteriota bacterium]